MLIQTSSVCWHIGIAVMSYVFHGFHQCLGFFNDGNNDGNNGNKIRPCRGNRQGRILLPF